MIASIILHAVHVNEIDLQLEGRMLSPCLLIAVMKAFRHIGGRQPSSNNNWKINVEFLNESSTLGIPVSYWRFNRKCTFQDGCRQHLGFQITADHDIFLLLDQSSPNLVRISRIRYKTHLSCYVNAYALLANGGYLFIYRLPWSRRLFP